MVRRAGRVKTRWAIPDGDANSSITIPSQARMTSLRRRSRQLPPALRTHLRHPLRRLGIAVIGMNRCKLGAVLEVHEPFFAFVPGIRRQDQLRSNALSILDEGALVGESRGRKKHQN